MKLASILILIMLPCFGLAQDFSVSVVDLDGKALSDTLGIVPSWVKVKVTPGDQSMRFRFKRVEAILARKNARVATINSRSPNLDLQVLTSQMNPGDHLVLLVYIDEVDGEKSLHEYTRTLNYPLSKKRPH